MSFEHIQSTHHGAILYDASVLRNPHAPLFERAYWMQQGVLQEVAGGRGSVCFLHTGAGNWVLRHYRRGGLAAKVSGDKYWWSGQERTRSFLEWRLLARLHSMGLPVPAPVAAGYVRSSLWYSADLITQEIPHSRTLADAITGASLPQSGWHDIGRVIGRFHCHGVQHADLNAHNILLTSAAEASVYLIDFDRGRIRARGSWEQLVLARLKRSLEKVCRQRAQVNFGPEQWAWLLQGWSQGLRRDA